MCRGHDQDEHNSTCFKTVWKEIWSFKYVKYKTEYSWWRFTIYRSRVLQISKRVSELVPICFQSYLNVSGICEIDQCPFNKTNINCTLDCRCVPQQYEACYTNGTCMCYSVLTVDGAPKGQNNGSSSGPMIGGSLSGAFLALFAVTVGFAIFKKRKLTNSCIP